MVAICQPCSTKGQKKDDISINYIQKSVQYILYTHTHTKSIYNLPYIKERSPVVQSCPPLLLILISLT